MFESLIRLSTLDGASSNPRYLECLDKTLPFKKFSIVCEDHGGFNIAGKVGDHASVDVSGQIHWSLSLNHPMARKLCPKILKDICRDWIRIKRGPPPALARRRLKALLRIGLAGQARSLQKELLMVFFPNGDPCQRGRIDVWVPVWAVVSLEPLVDAVSKSFSYMFFFYECTDNQEVAMARTLPRRFGLYHAGRPVRYRRRDGYKILRIGMPLHFRRHPVEIISTSMTSTSIEH